MYVWKHRGLKRVGRRASIIEGERVYDWRSRIMASVMPMALVSDVFRAAIALVATFPTQFSRSHPVTSSMAAPGQAGCAV